MESNGSSANNVEVGNCVISLDRLNYNQAYYDPSQNVVICYTQEENPEMASVSASKDKSIEVSMMETDESFADGESSSNYFSDVLKQKATIQRLFAQKKAVVIKKTFPGGPKKLTDVWNFFGDIRLFISDTEAEKLKISYTIKFTDRSQNNAMMILKSFVGCLTCKGLFPYDGEKTTTLRYHIKACSTPKKEEHHRTYVKRSFAWDHFSKLDDQRAMCNICDRVISYKGGGPYNLTRHLKGKHGKTSKDDSTQFQAEESWSSSDHDPSWEPEGEKMDETGKTLSKKKKKDRKTSIAWEFFSEIGPCKAVCNLCNKVMSYKGGGPFNLIRHIKSQHAEHLKGHKAEKSELDSVPDSPIQEVERAIQAITYVPHVNKLKVPDLPSSYADDLNRSLVALICKHYLPFSFVESDSFKELGRSLNPSYVPPSKKTLSTALLDKYYALEKEQVQKELQEADYIALTVEGWTSVAGENYLCLTAHFINNSTELKSFLLECLQYSKEGSDEDLKDKIEAMCEEWGIKRKVVCVTTDNQDTIEMSIRMMGVDHVSCFAHILNMAVITALEGIASTRSIVKTIVEHFKCTPLAFKKVKDMQIQLGKENPYLVNDITSSWNSTFDMFESVINARQSLMLVLNQDYPNLPELNDQTFITLKNVNELLTIFKSVTEEISAEKKVTVSEVIILSNVLLNKCRKFLLNTAGEVKIMAQTLVKNLEVHFSKIEENKVFSVATVLDPRFKKHGFKNIYAYEQAVLDTKQMAGDIDLHSNEIEVENDLVNDEPKEDKEYSIWDDFDKNTEEMTDNCSSSTAGSIETDRYLQEPLLKRTQDPLKWWHEKRDIYPRLYQLVKQRMCIAASSIPSENLFSESGRLVTEKRNSLSGSKVSKVVFLNYNM